MNEPAAPAGAPAPAMISRVQPGSAPTGLTGRSAWAHRRVVDGAVLVFALGLGACIGMGVDTESAGALRAAGGVATFAGQITGLVGTYLLLVMLLLIARIPVVERAAGHDRLVKWHRNLGQWPVYLLLLHAVLVTVGYARQARVGYLHQLGVLLRSYPDVLAATVAFGLIVVAAVSSIRAARRRMRYETWWTVHLYLYLALALSVAHQIANGQSFVGHPLTRVIWAALWIATAGTVLVFRVVAPLARSAYHGLRVVGVTEEAPGVYSVVCHGRHLERLGTRGGQFFYWRFLTRELWWQGHPYSLSALPQRGFMRVTVKDLGDHSAALGRIRVGTRVAIEGPYGAFTRDHLGGPKVLLVGAGVGVTPIRALLEDLPPDADITVLLRASSPEEVLFRAEFESLVGQRRGRLVELHGSRRKHPFDHRQLLRLVPDITARDVYICGPEALGRQVTASARALGIDRERIHCEEFVF